MCDRDEFEYWADEFDHSSVYWKDMGRDEIFMAGMQSARAQGGESEDNWIWPTKQNPEPKHDGNWLTYRPDAPADSQVATIWYDSKHNGWSGKHRVAAWMKRPNPPAEQDGE